MERIDWSKAPEWADRVVRGGTLDVSYWANDCKLKPLNNSCPPFKTNTHVRDNFQVVERRPTADTGIDWSKAPHWADKQHVRDNWEVVERRPEFVPGKPLVTFSHPCNAEPAPITIEQRIASLRALEKQVEETRAELTRDLETLGLTWMVRDEPEQPTITDWRDLRVGDVIGFDGVDGEWDILNLEDEYDEAPIKVSDDINAECTVEGWVNILSHPWRFIRRP